MLHIVSQRGKLKQKLNNAFNWINITANFPFFVVVVVIYKSNKNIFNQKFDLINEIN